MKATKYLCACFLTRTCIYGQAWKLREEGRLLDLVDSELTDYDEKQMLRFIMVALFCTQAAAQHRPTMKQVIKMLTKEVHLNERALTEPGIYRWNSSKECGNSSSSSQANKNGSSKFPYMTSSYFSGADLDTQILPR